MNGENNKKLNNTNKKTFKGMSAMDMSRSEESKEYFSEEAVKNFGANERGAEDVFDMMAKGQL